MQKQTVHYMVDEFSGTTSKWKATYRGAGFAIWVRRWGAMPVSFSISDMREVFGNECRVLVKSVVAWASW